MNLGRTYELTIVNPQGEQKIIKPPLTLELEVTRNTLATTNGVTLTLTNLGVSTRNWLFKDRYAFALNWQMQLKAGYNGNNLYTIFLGNVMEAYSSKEGTEWKTHIVGYDGLFGLQNGFINTTLSSSATGKDIADKIKSSMPNIAQGLWGKPTLGQTQGRGIVLAGASRDVLNELYPGSWYIDDGKLTILGDSEIDPSDVLKLNSDYLLKTPERHDALLDISMMFYPQARIGILAEIDSLYPIYNGQYKVIGLKHHGIISEAQNGDLITELNLYAGAGAFTPVS